MLSNERVKSMLEECIETMACNTNPDDEKNRYNYMIARTRADALAEVLGLTEGTDWLSELKE